jgi:hypothetical protein
MVLAWCLVVVMVVVIAWLVGETAKVGMSGVSSAVGRRWERSSLSPVAEGLSPSWVLF